MKNKFIDTLTKMNPEEKTSLFIKSYLCCLLPYPTEGIIDVSDLPDPDVFNKVLEKVDHSALQSSNYILENYLIITLVCILQQVKLFQNFGFPDGLEILKSLLQEY